MEAAGKRYIYYGSRANEFKIWALADMHIGNANVEMDRLKRDIRKIKDDPYSFWFGLGDYADYIGPGDKRFDPESLDENLKARDLGKLGTVLTDMVADLLSPIKDKCLGLGFGNHEFKYCKINNQQGLHQKLCESLGVPNLGYSSLFDLVFVRMGGIEIPVLEPDLRKNYKSGTCYQRRFYTHHGCGGATTKGGKLNSLMRMMNRFDADIFACAHLHDDITTPLIRIAATPDCKRLVEDRKVGFITGSYLKTYAQGETGYGEIKGYDPVPLGATHVLIKPDKGEVTTRI